MTKRSKAQAKKWRLLVVDDHPMMRHGIAQLLNGEPDMTVCDEAESARQAISQVREHRPDLVLADLTMPGKDGLDLIRDLQAQHPNIPTLVISMHDETLYAERVLRAGGRGYIMKHEGGDKLLAAIRRVLKGKVYVSERISEQILENLSGLAPAASSSVISRLSDRELEVFRMIGEANETREIAAQLGMSAKTVEAHRLNIKRKLRLRTSAELTRRAVLWVESGSAPKTQAKID